MNGFIILLWCEQTDRRWCEGEEEESHQTSSKRYFKSFLFRCWTESKQRRISARRLHKHGIIKERKLWFLSSVDMAFHTFSSSTVYNLLEQINFLPPATHARSPPAALRSAEWKAKKSRSKTTTISKTHKQIKSLPSPNKSRPKWGRRKRLRLATNRIL